MLTTSSGPSPPQALYILAQFSECISDPTHVLFRSTALPRSLTKDCCFVGAVPERQGPVGVFSPLSVPCGHFV